MRQKSDPSPVFPQAPLPGGPDSDPEEHEGEGLPPWMHFTMGDRHPRVVIVLDPEGLADINSLDSVSLGWLVRLGALHVTEPEMPWGRAVLEASAYEPNDTYALRQLLRRYATA